MTVPDRTLNSRYECKYYIPEAMVPALRYQLRPFMRLDPYSARSRGYRYTISSLYLDSPGLDFYESTMRAQRNRFKLRVRAYSDDPGDPVFFEVKARSDQIVSKERAALPRHVARRVLEGRGCPEELCPERAFGRFVALSRRMDARPLIRVRYQREAYESSDGSPVRVTFDTQLSYAVTPTAELSVGGEGWHPRPLEGVILEIKFTNARPPWYGSLLHQFQLDRCSIPKYCLMVGDALSHHRLRRGQQVAGRD